MDWNTVRDRFARDQRVAGLSPRTIDSRDKLLQMLERSSGVRPQLITKHDLVDLLDRPHAHTGKPLSAGTKQVERSYLQVWGRWMVDEGYMAHDPSARVPRVKIPRRKPRPLRLEHIDLMFTSAYSRTRDLIAVAAMSSLRIGEVVRIRGEDVDWITLRITTLRKGGFTQSIPMPPGLVEIAERMPRKGWWFPSSYKNSLYPNGDGHILMKSASRTISGVLRRVGIIDPAITAHSLRHFYATWLLAQGVSVRVVQELMGHASLATTQLYMEVTEAQTDAAASELPRIDPLSQRRARSGRLAA